MIPLATLSGATGPASLRVGTRGASGEDAGFASLLGIGTDGADVVPAAGLAGSGTAVARQQPAATGKIAPGKIAPGIAPAPAADDTDWLAAMLGGTAPDAEASAPPTPVIDPAAVPAVSPKTIGRGKPAKADLPGDLAALVDSKTGAAAKAGVSLAPRSGQRTVGPKVDQQSTDTPVDAEPVDPKPINDSPVEAPVTDTPPVIALAADLPLTAPIPAVLRRGGKDANQPVASPSPRPTARPVITTRAAALTREVAPAAIGGATLPAVLPTTTAPTATVTRGRTEKPSPTAVSVPSSPVPLITATETPTPGPAVSAGQTPTPSPAATVLTSPSPKPIAIAQADTPRSTPPASDQTRQVPPVSAQEAAPTPLPERAADVALAAAATPFQASAPVSTATAAPNPATTFAMPMATRPTAQPAMVASARPAARWTAVQPTISADQPEALFAAVPAPSGSRPASSAVQTPMPGAADPAVPTAVRLQTPQPGPVGASVALPTPTTSVATTSSSTTTVATAAEPIAARVARPDAPAAIVQRPNWTMTAIPTVAPAPAAIGAAATPDRSAIPPVPTPDQVAVAIPATPAEANGTAPASTPMAAPAPNFVGETAPARQQPTAPTTLSPAAAAAAALPPTAPPSPATRGPVAPAGEVFAAAIRAAGRDQSDEPRDPAAMLSASVTAAAPIAAPAAATGHGGTSLDMRQNDWPSAMIDHIEKLRDAADAADTRIRVVPDALGSIDVSLRRHDGGVQVTLAADQPATQAMLADARPQLVAMAESRGVRLADASLAGSGGGDPATGGQRQPPATPLQPPRARAAATYSDDPDAADGRVA